MNKLIPFLFGLVLISCGSGKEKRIADKTGPTVVSVVNYPLFYFAERVGGEMILVEFPAPPDVDPAYWIPDDDALSKIQSSDLILANGADYAKWMKQVSLPASRIINTSARAKEKYVEVTEGASHSHGPEGEHVHTGYAFTTWLDFQIALTQASAVKEALMVNVPDKQEILEENYMALEGEIMELHTSMKELSEKLVNAYIIGSHPVYQYLSAAYGLHIHSVHFEPGEMPSEKQWEDFDRLLASHPTRIMLWEGEPLPEVKEILLEKGIMALVFNPCGNRPENGDFMEVMKNNIQTLQSSLAN
jgi:zinc transport system substrate-binding protein